MEPVFCSPDIDVVLVIKRYLPENNYNNPVFYRKSSINTANGSCMFGVLFESMLIKVKNKGD